MKKMIIAAALLLSACSAQSVYDQPLPDPDDKAAIEKISNGLKLSDQMTWAMYSFRAANQKGGMIKDTIGVPNQDPPTVGAAIEEQRAWLEQNRKELASPVQ